MITKTPIEVISEKPEIIAEKPIDEKPIEPIELPQPTYTISRYEQNGDSLFICLNSTEAPVYLEHYFTEEEKVYVKTTVPIPTEPFAVEEIKLDVSATITKLVAELELMAEAYQVPVASVNLMSEVKQMVIVPEEVVVQKAIIIEERSKETEPIAEEIIAEIPQENELQDTQLT